MIGISGSVICSETLMKLIFNPYCEFRLSPEDPLRQIHSLQLLAGAPGIFSDILWYVQMLKRERERERERAWGAESNGKLPHLFIPSKTATFVPDFVVKDVPLGRTVMIMMLMVMNIQ